MIRSKDELLSGFNEIIGENTDDTILSFIEDISDTYDDLQTKSNDTENWKERYENNDKEWRQKYKDRFMNRNDIEPDLEVEETQPSKPMRFEDLFE